MPTRGSPRGVKERRPGTSACKGLIMQGSAGRARPRHSRPQGSCSHPPACLGRSQRGVRCYRRDTCPYDSDNVPAYGCRQCTLVQRESVHLCIFLSNVGAGGFGRNRRDRFPKRVLRVYHGIMFGTAMAAPAFTFVFTCMRVPPSALCVTDRQGNHNPCYPSPVATPAAIRLFPALIFVFTFMCTSPVRGASDE